MINGSGKEMHDLFCEEEFKKALSLEEYDNGRFIDFFISRVDILQCFLDFSLSKKNVPTTCPPQGSFESWDSFSFDNPCNETDL